MKANNEPETPHEKPRRWLNRTVGGAGLTSALGDFSYETTTVILPGFLAVLGIPAAVLGFIEEIADAVSSFTKMGSGCIADNLGRWRWCGCAGTAALDTRDKPGASLVKRRGIMRESSSRSSNETGLPPHKDEERDGCEFGDQGESDHRQLPGCVEDVPLAAAARFGVDHAGDREGMWGLADQQSRHLIPSSPF